MKKILLATAMVLSLAISAQAKQAATFAAQATEIKDLRGNAIMLEKNKFERIAGGLNGASYRYTYQNFAFAGLTAGAVTITFSEKNFNDFKMAAFKIVLLNGVLGENLILTFKIPGAVISDFNVSFDRNAIFQTYNWKKDGKITFSDNRLSYFAPIYQNTITYAEIAKARLAGNLWALLGTNAQTYVEVLKRAADVDGQFADKVFRLITFDAKFLDYYQVVYGKALDRAGFIMHAKEFEQIQFGMIQNWLVIRFADKAWLQNGSKWIPTAGNDIIL